MSQMSFADAGKRKKTRREVFLEEMARLFSRPDRDRFEAVQSTYLPAA